MMLPRRAAMKSDIASARWREGLAVPVAAHNIKTRHIIAPDTSSEVPVMLQTPVMT